MVTQTEIETIQANVLRQVYATAGAIASIINSGGLTLDAYKAAAVNSAHNRTMPPLVVCNQLEGGAPDSPRLTSLANFSEGQYNAYAASGVANPGLGPYEALGSALADTTGFPLLVAGKTVAQIIDAHYRQAFARAPTAAQVTHFDGQYAYFYGIYVGAGVAAATADLRAKGAMLGQLLGYAAQEAGSPTQLKARAWLFNAANGSPAYNVAL